ncbi:PREDICTED: transcriptional regulator ATRX-like [Wasmannia auropunctata]|uniref:transcriptional regulator ATRX-like n=1 Tax=Wasmannia auropunctata TaxID=64793 RepID=UPI0005EF1FEE|nr:PREDICTED: transcriptional regulator ATRX-like [Wasmannia auropunctata]
MIKDRQIVCSTCDNELNIETKRIFSHPFIGILQCEVCWKHFKNIQLKFDEEKSRNHCHICGGNKKLFVCCNKDCFSACCKGCIKRNVSLSLLDVEKEDWKCFICNPKPIWDLRAVCATVMDSLPNATQGQTNEKQSSQGKERELQVRLEKLMPKEIILLTQKKLPEKMTIKSQRNGDFIIDGPSTSTARHSSSDLVSVDSKHSEKAICITDSQITKASDKKENSPPCSPWTNSKNVAKFKMNTKTLFACPHCGVPFSSKHCVAHHVNKTCLSNPYSRTNREAGRHQCQQCGRNYGKEKSLRHHQKHECNQRVTCEKCGSTFQGTIVPVRHRKKCGIDQNSSKIEKMMKKENTRDEPFEDDSSIDFSD